MKDLEKYTLRIADTSLILAQRLSEWCSNGPTLEEDIALTRSFWTSKWITRLCFKIKW
jgi:1,2-phenylacetyl-CoA epoxidase catalytic subunit